MAGMDAGSQNTVISPRDRILQRLASHGVPQERLDESQAGLVDFVRENKSMIPEIVSYILPTYEDVSEARMSFKKDSGEGAGAVSMKDLFGESLLWLQWLMFEGCPHATLKNLAQKACGQRGVCGAVWGQNDLAYHCRTCEHDPTCAICVPCFQNGNHKDHDYSIIYTGGGCCDCGDETAWKRDGFCSKHKGAEQIQPLPEDLAHSVGPVLDALLVCWKDKAISVKHQRHEGESDRSDVYGQAANELSSAVVEMLLDFCNCTESLLCFISRRMFECVGLLEVLVGAERFLDKKVARKLHELLLKLLGEPLFKYELAKIYIKYYPFTVSEIIKECSDSMLEKYPMLSTFSVQIFTVPTLTSRLVREVDLLRILMGCLNNLFLSFVAEDGRLQANKWAKLSETTIRLVEDIRYVMSHDEVPRYLADERPDISRTWIRLLSLVQGMDPQKRVTGLLSEEENGNHPAPFVLAHFLGNVNCLLVEGAFSVAAQKEMEDAALCCSDNQASDDGDRHRHAKVERFYQESSACTISGRKIVQDCVLQNGGVKDGRGSCLSVPPSVMWLILECLKAIESWFSSDTALRSNSSSVVPSSSSGSNIMALGKKLLRIRRATNSNRVYGRSMSSVDIDGLHVPAHNECHEMLGSSSTSRGVAGILEVEKREVLDQNNTSIGYTDITNLYSEHARILGVSDDSLVELGYGTELEAFSILNSADWPNIICDVSSQELSFHIPLHRLLSLLLRKVMRTCYTEAGKLDKQNGISAPLSSGHHHDFCSKVVGGLQPCGFSAFVMEHPLRLRVFCAQVRAGMWRKNGDAAILTSEWYRSVQWLEQGLESDLFLLQFCAALAPPELFVKRIQDRFGLSNYTSLNLSDCNEYEPVLVQEMLTLLIQIVQERRFCGLSRTENLRRELVCKLAIGDATHSQLIKALPRDLSKSDQLKNVLDTIAVYSNPSGLKQGKYSLRQAHWKELDLYHPRWNSKDLQVAEERYFSCCKVSAVNVQLPRWKGIFDPLKKISRIATSKAVFQIVRAILYHALFTQSSSVSRAPDGVLIKGLHLLSLALDICENQNQICDDTVGTNVEISHLDDCSLVDIHHPTENLFPILTYAGKKFESGAANESILSKDQSMLSLLVSLMRKYQGESLNNYAETRQFNFSSSIENLLKKFAQLSADCMSALKRLVPDVFCRMPQHSPNTLIQNTALVSDIEKRRAQARMHQASILEKMRAEQSKFIASIESAPNVEPDFSKAKQEVSFSEVDRVTEESSPVCSLCRDPDSQSPLCFLILLQKSRLTSFVERGPPSWENAGQSDEILLVRKEELIDPSGADSSSPLLLAQNTGLDFPYDIELAEVDGFLDSFKEQLPDTGNTHLLYDTGTHTTLSLEGMENDIYHSVKEDMHDIESSSDALGAKQKRSTSQIAVGSVDSNYIESYLLGEYVASLSRETSRQNQYSMYDHLHLAKVSSRSTIPTTKFVGFGPRDCDGIHISSCGHAVHQDCHDRYLTSLKQRNIRRLGFEVRHIVDPNMGELLCPVCRRIANSILPAFPGVSNRARRRHMSSAGSPIPNEVVSASSDMDNNNLRLPLALSLLQSTSKMVGQGQFLKVFSRKLSETFEPALEPALHKLLMLYYPLNFSNLSASGRLRPSLILWDTLTYSLASTEIASRGKMTTSAVDSASCLETLYGELSSILSLLFHVAQTARSLNCLEVLLRFRGIQLLAGSICSDISGDNNRSNTDKRRGAFSSILERGDKGETFPDIQFWKRAADPVLAHDPFSSLMWVLFCLPLPFISSMEFLIPLVHLFYVVCVVQAMVTCYCKQYFDISSFGDCLLNDVCKTMGESELVRKYFVTNYIESSCHPKDMIRKLTLPYLRRCALLWKLLQSPASTPLFDYSTLWESSSPSMNNNAIDCPNRLTLELNGVSELEDMFQIQPLELVLKDENVHALALKWCEHFREEFGVRKIGGILFSTPAVPFKLMQLPRLYQDLLQRYINLQCSDCKSVPDEPALCLLCGKLCSLSWKFCCRASRCVNHATVCGAGIGVFLLVRKTTILLQRSSRQAVWPSPFLDAFGEEDLNMYRGKPLYLSEERYATLTYLVASHGLDRTSEVLRQTTMALYGSD